MITKWCLFQEHEHLHHSSSKEEISHGKEVDVTPCRVLDLLVTGPASYTYHCRPMILQGYAYL